MIALESGPKFPLGQLLITPNAANRIPPEDVLVAIRRHARGDWGELDDHDLQENERSLKDGCRLFSAYRAGNGEDFWVITEADRAHTTVLLPEDY